MVGSEHYLEARGISKAFGSQLALDKVDFDLNAGEVHALLGENGAGKSTLIKIITGAYQPDGGIIKLDGQPVSFRDPLQAQAAGIGTVYQEVNLLPNMTVAENIFLGRQPTRFGIVQKKLVEQAARATLLKYGIEIDVSAQVATLPVAIQQIIAIARAVELSGKVLVLDEPTASLDRVEVEKLFSVLRLLKSRGLAIVFITHFLDQVFELADRATVLRNGKLIGTEKVNRLTRTSLVRMMLGKDISLQSHPVMVGERKAGEELVSFTNMGLRGVISPFSLNIHKGEVVGVAGLLGSGRTEIARLMFGVDEADEGEIKMGGKTVSIRSTSDAIALGFGFCPEDRKTNGILAELSVRENIIIALQGKLGWFKTLNHDEQLEIAEKFMESLDIRASSAEQPMKSLSGGNQQKVILARWLATDPRLLILDEPTRGIDVGAHAEIVRAINSLRDDGLALIVISSELDEIVAYSSRVVVMHDRKVAVELRGKDITPSVIVQAIASQHPEQMV
ncbi:MAG: sugar ABC transporter ATP-binding protein [Aestuariivirga sp.]